MVIEWLKFTVDSEKREQFIQEDEAIWTAALATYPGFMGKEVWIEPNQPSSVIFTIRWQTREQWKSIPVKDLQEIEGNFARVMEQANISYKMTQSKEFQIRKFPNNQK